MGLWDAGNLSAVAAELRPGWGTGRFSGMAQRIVSAAAALVAGLSAVARAQTIELQLTEDLNRSPVPGAIVRLLSENKIVVQGLTNQQGRIALRAPAPGTYRIKADRIGFTGAVVGPIDLAAGETVRRELLMPSTRVELPTLTVRGNSKCEARDSGGGAVAVTLWEEVQKALTANVLTGRGGSVPLQVRSFVREVDRQGQVLRQWVFASALVRGQPFTSLAPAALAQRGFVEDEGDSVTYAAPDAALLLSDEFVGTHCFRAEPGKDALVGLTFEPIRGRRQRDVRGTLWVNRGTNELQFIEFGFTGLSGDLAKDLGGRVEFRRLPTGSWIVSYWHIRMPHLESHEVRGPGNTLQSVIRLRGFLDLGGRTEIAPDAMRRIDRAMIMGRIFDSASGRGLAEAVVSVRGFPDTAFTDSDGRFQLVVAGSGDQVVQVSHPRLGLTGEPVKRPALLSLGDTTVVGFGVPPISRFATMYCGGRARRAGLVGMAWSEKREPAEGLMVRATWLGVSGGANQATSRTGERGVFALCNLPSGPTLTVRLLDGFKPLVEQTVRLERSEFRWMDLRPY